MKAGKIFKFILLLVFFAATAQSQSYVVGYILSNGLEERLPNNSIRIYQKFRSEAYVQMNSQTRKTYSDVNALKNITELTSQTLMQPEFQGTMTFRRSSLPQHFWIKSKQIVLIQVDISRLQQKMQEKGKYQRLYKQKGAWFFMIDTAKENQTISPEIGQIIGFDAHKDTLCPINIQGNTMQENTALITECYEKSLKEATKVTLKTSFMSMISQYGFMGIFYMGLTSIIVCLSPYIMIWSERRKSRHSSHV